MKNAQYVRASHYIFKLEGYEDISELAHEIKNFEFNGSFGDTESFVLHNSIKVKYYDTPAITKLLKSHGETVRFEFIQLNDDSTPMRSFVGNATINGFNFGKFNYEYGNEASTVTALLDLSEVKMSDTKNSIDTSSRW